MARLTLTKAQTELADIVNRAARNKERTVLSRGGKDVAAIVPIADFRLLERKAKEDQTDLEAARIALAERGKRVTLRDFIREIGD